MYYNNSKKEGYGEGAMINESKISHQSFCPSKGQKCSYTKEELGQMKESINDMRCKMYKTAQFEEGKDVVITDETIKVSQELDVLILKYYEKMRCSAKEK